MTLRFVLFVVALASVSSFMPTTSRRVGTKLSMQGDGLKVRQRGDSINTTI